MCEQLVYIYNLMFYILREVLIKTRDFVYLDTDNDNDNLFHTQNSSFFIFKIIINNK